MKGGKRERGKGSGKKDKGEKRDETPHTFMHKERLHHTGQWHSVSGGKRGKWERDARLQLPFFLLLLPPCQQENKQMTGKPIYPNQCWVAITLYHRTSSLPHCQRGKGCGYVSRR